MSSWLWGASPFDEMVDKATSELALAGSEDIALNLEICDQIRSKTVQPKDAMRSIKRRLDHQNPNVQLLTLSLLDTCIKNGGDHFLIEIASREFMDNLVSILKKAGLNREVRDKILRNIQNWAIALEGRYNLSYVVETYKTLQREGYTFPPKDTVSAAMIDTATAPEWIDSDVCLRCRTPFTFTNRKHHCRNCGKVYDQQCSSKSLPLPHFGIAEPVRVCDSCHFILKKKNEPKGGGGHHKANALPRPPKPRHAREDEDLQKAIALSLQESKPNQRAGYVPGSNWNGASEPPAIDVKSRPQANEEEDDPELRAAIEASLREMNAPKPSAPAENGEESELQESPTELHPLEADAIMNFNQTIQEAVTRGTRDLVRYPGVNEMFQRASTLEPKMTMDLEETAGRTEMLANMHEKLSEAVKLYDKILTEQIANPARRYGAYNPQPAPSTWQPAQPAQPSYYARPAPQHNQWTQPQHQSGWGPQQSVYAPPVSQQYPVRQDTYAQSAIAPPAPVQQYQPPPPVEQYSAYAPPAPQSYGQSNTMQAAPSAPATVSIPVTTPQPIQEPSQPVYSPPSPVQQYVPPPQPANPRMYASPPPPTPVVAPPLAHHTPQPQQPQRYVPPVHLPNLPSAPTLEPQPTYYAPPVEHREPKEALLISFD